MGYRYNMPVDRNGEPPKPEEMLPRFEIRNGAILNIAFGCHYVMHDHHHPMYVYPHIAGDAAVLRRENHVPYDRLSQAKFPVKYEPIDFDSEDIRNIEILIEEDDGNISIENAYFDINRVCISMRVNYPEFHDIPVEKRFTVFVSNDDNSHIDSVCHGIIVVLPGPSFSYSEEPSEDIESEE